MARRVYFSRGVVLLFKKAFWDGLTSGAITLTFRRWNKPHVKEGGRYRCHPIGVLVVDGVSVVTRGRLTEEDARRAGFTSREALIEYLSELGPMDDASPIHRVELHHGGDGDRVALALEADLSADDVVAIRKKLDALDAKGPTPAAISAAAGAAVSGRGRARAWTMKTLAIIEKHPRIAASQLAAKLGRETASFKVDVRKLKKLGLTQSFEVGYEIAPRGRSYLDAVRRAR